MNISIRNILDNSKIYKNMFFNHIRLNMELNASEEELDIYINQRKDVDFILISREKN